MSTKQRNHVRNTGYVTSIMMVNVGKKQMREALKGQGQNKTYNKTLKQCMYMISEIANNDGGLSQGIVQPNPKSGKHNVSSLRRRGLCNALL
jgi:hypothetical protein